MLNDEKPRFSVKDIGLIVFYTAAMVMAYSNLKSSIEVERLRIDIIKSTGIPRRIDRLEYLICATADEARQMACERMGVLK